MTALVRVYASIGRGVGVALAMLVWLVLPRIAAAAADVVPAADDGRCLAARALSGLTPAEHTRLFTLCSTRGRPGPSDAPLLARLAARMTWESAALGELLAGAAPHLDLGPDPADLKRLQAVRRALREALVDRRGLTTVPGCKPLAAAVDAYAADRDAREPTTAPFAGAYLEDGRCVAVDAAALADLNILTVPADDADALFVAASAGDRVVLQWFGPEDVVVHRGRRLFVVAVPGWSTVTVRATPRDAAAAATWHNFVIQDATLWDRAPAAGCLRLSVDLDADTTLLLDGRVLTRGKPLAHRTVGVIDGAHELVALRCAARGACAVRFREVLPASDRTGTQNLCQDLALDLHQPSSVAVLRVTAAPGCDAALAWRAAGLAADYLRRSETATGRVFRDLASYATLTEALGAMRTSLNPGAGATVGAQTGADSLEVVATVAKEAWRQGIDELISLELRCTPGDAADLALQGSALSVRDVFNRAQGEVAGLDIKQILRVQSLDFRGAAQLESTVAGVLDQLLGRSYLRIREGAGVFAYRQRARVELAAYGHSEEVGRPELSAYHIAEPHHGAPRVCQALDRDDRRPALSFVEEHTRNVSRRERIRVPLGDELDILVDGLEETREVVRTVAGDQAAGMIPRVTVDKRLRPAAATRIEGSFRARRPGTYLVVARRRRADGTTAIADATCVRFDVPAHELWASVVFAPDLTTRTPIRSWGARHLRVQIGHTWYRPRDWLGLGVAGGYTYTRYVSSAGLPSWQDFQIDAATGRSELDWHRHAIVIGPLVEVRSRRATLPVEFRARLAAALGVAIIDVSDLLGFPDFATPAQFGTSKLRVAPTADLTLELGFGYDAGPLAVAHVISLGAVALNDMRSGRTSVTAIGGAGLFAGLGLILGGKP